MLRAAMVVAIVALSGAKGFRALHPGDAKALTTLAEPVVAATWLSRHLKDQDLVIVQTGPRAEYDKGHIPGARNVPHWTLLTDTGLLLSPAEITAKFRAAGVQPGDTVVAYCHVGVQATAAVFAARLIGQPMTMYIGSFHDWSAHNLPAEGSKP